MNFDGFYFNTSLKGENMSKCILAVAYGEKYEMMADVMIDTFLKYNNSYNVEKIYGSKIKVPAACTQNGKITPFDACEIGRWIAIRELLEKYDEVLYSDNDIWWYSQYKPLNAGIILSPHFVTNKGKWNCRQSQFRAGIYNEGIIYCNGNDGKKACDYIIQETSLNKNRLLSPTTGQLWLQYLEPCLTEIGIDCKIDNNPGNNVAFWNLVSGDRSLEKHDDKYFVKCNNIEYPLQSFHFSSSSINELPKISETGHKLSKEYTEMMEFIRLKTLHNNDLCFQLRDQNSKNGLLQLVNKNFNEKTGLTMIEIGSYQGESAEIFLSTGVFDKIYCIDGWENGYDNADKASFTADRAEKAFDKRFANDSRIIKIKGFSQDVVDKIPDGIADFLYVDGCHTYEAVKRDLQMYSCKVKPDGILAGHDYFPGEWQGVVNAVDEFLGHKPAGTYCDTSWSNPKETAFGKDQA